MTGISERILVVEDEDALCGNVRVSETFSRLHGEQPVMVPPLRIWENNFLSGSAGRPLMQFLNSLIFFDFRPVRGNSMIAEALRTFLSQRLGNQHIFFAHMSGVIARNRPPVGVLIKNQTEKGRRVQTYMQYKNQFSQSDRGRCMSFRALKLGIYAISTIDRLCELKERLGPIGVLSSDLGQAVEFLMSARIGHQFELRENG